MHLRVPGSRAAFIVIAGLLSVVLAIGHSPGSGAAGDDIKPDPVVDAPDPDLKDQVLLEMVADRSVHPQATVSVEVHGPDLESARRAVTRVGGDTYGEVPGFFIEASVLVDRVNALAADPAVDRVSRLTQGSSALRPPTTRQLQTEGILQTVIEDSLSVGEWHDAGYRGAGQKIGILDVFGRIEYDEAIADDRIPEPAGVLCLKRGRQCSITELNSAPHGVGVAELAHRAAPDAQLYLATVYTLADLSAAIDWFAAEGVTIINRSETSEFDGPGDGTGPVASIIDRAIDNGMVFVAAAGNAGGEPGRRGQNWIGTFNDPDGNGVHNWSNGTELMEFECGFLLGMRWDDWGTDTIATDYDLWIYDLPDDESPEARANDVQVAVADPPLEHIEPRCAFAGDLDYMSIVRFGDEQPDGDDEIQILGNFTPMEEWSNRSSATGPGSDSANPGSVTVGATIRPSSLTHASYSSQGPTLDGRVTPDLLGPSCFPVQNFAGCFSGTSSSAPFVAGVLAILRGAGVYSSATDVDAILPRITVDQGDEGLDVKYGHGSLVLPPPSEFGLLPVDQLCWGQTPTIVGTDGDDVLIGTDGKDVIFGGPGNDLILGGRGSDTICGNDGRDVIRGGQGRDFIDGGPRRDRIWGEAGADYIIGGTGLDRIVANAGNDVVNGLGNNDRLKGGPGDDILRGGAGDDRIEGQVGGDTLIGGIGIDICQVAPAGADREPGDNVSKCEL